MTPTDVADDALPRFRERAMRLWNETGLLNVKPASPRYGEYPEGWDVVRELRRILTPFVDGAVLEFGCGYGRLCRAFDARVYTGVDINAAAIRRARELWPDYTFGEVAYQGDYPDAALVVFYTVLLHMAEADVRTLLARFGAASTVKTLAIAEVMTDRVVETNTSQTYDTQDRLHAVFNRLPSVYESIAREAGFVLFETIIRPYRFYAGTDLHILLFRRPEIPTLVVVPGGLGNPDLSIEGLHEDGWTSPRVRLTLDRPADARYFVLDGLFLTFEGQPGTLSIAVAFDANEAHCLEAAPGEVRIKQALDAPAGVLEVTLHFPQPIFLPDPDGRWVGLLLKRIGFER